VTGSLVEQAIRSYLESKREARERFLAQLVAVPSDNPPGDCRPHAARALMLLAALGFTVEEHPVPDEIARAHGMIGVVNLVVRERFADGPTIALNAHGDVVPPGLGWTTDPYGAEIRDGFMYGRGVAVSKSDFATYAYALLALKATGAPLRGTIELHFTYDEETGGTIGPRWLLEQGISKPDYVVSAGFSYGIITAHNGCLHLEAEILGRSAHAARPESGVDALEAATSVLARLYEIRRTYRNRVSAIEGIGSPSLTIGLISGGTNTNVVPDRVVFRLDRRIIPEEDAGQAEATLTAAIQSAAAPWPGITCTVRRVLLAEPFIPTAAQQPLVAAISRRASEIMGEPVVAHGVPLYTDARLYAAAGIPTVLYGAGPHTLLEANGHRADERLLLADLHRATEVMALALCDLLSV